MKVYNSQRNEETSSDFIATGKISNPWVFSNKTRNKNIFNITTDENMHDFIKYNNYDALTLTNTQQINLLITNKCNVLV